MQSYFSLSCERSVFTSAKAITAGLSIWSNTPVACVKAISSSTYEWCVSAPLSICTCLWMKINCFISLQCNTVQLDIKLSTQFKHITTVITLHIVVLFMVVVLVIKALGVVSWYRLWVDFVVFGGQRKERHQVSPGQVKQRGRGEAVPSCWSVVSMAVFPLKSRV